MGLAKEQIEKIECVTWDLLLEVYGQETVVPPIDLNRVANYEIDTRKPLALC